MQRAWSLGAIEETAAGVDAVVDSANRGKSGWNGASPRAFQDLRTHPLEEDIMKSHHSDPSSRGRRPAQIAIAVIAVGIAACSADESTESAGAPREVPSGMTEAAATVQMGGRSYTFSQVQCDLDDQVDDDVLLRAGGTAPDGRRMSLEVEQRRVGDMLHERVTLYFGSVTEGDQWHARASGSEGGSWATATAGDEPLDGPLIVIKDGVLTAEGAFVHETRDETQQGSLRARCAG